MSITQNQFNFEVLIEFLKNTQKPKIIIAIDGYGGSGKTSIAKEITRLGNFNIISIDDFPCYESEYLFHSLGTQTRISTDRIIRKVITPHLRDKVIKFIPTNWWKHEKQKNEKTFKPNNLLIIEGCYSSLPAINKYVDFTIWIESCRSKTLERVIARDGIDARQHWLNIYYPNEHKYVAKYKPKEKADLVIYN